MMAVVPTLSGLHWSDIEKIDKQKKLDAERKKLKSEQDSINAEEERKKQLEEDLAAIERVFKGGFTKPKPALKQLIPVKQ